MMEPDAPEPVKRTQRGVRALLQDLRLETRRRRKPTTPADHAAVAAAEAKRARKRQRNLSW